MYCDYVDRVYSIQLIIKDTTYTDRSSSYVHLQQYIDSVSLLRPNILDNRNDFLIMNFLFRVPLYRWCHFTKSFQVNDYIYCIILTELEIQIILDTASIMLYFDLHLETDIENQTLPQKR
jgi:hypothetical protein